MSSPSNPFEAYGYHPGLMDLTVQALKRGHNGEGGAVSIIFVGTDSTKGEDFTVDISRDNGRVIGNRVDNDVGPESARNVG